MSWLPRTAAMLLLPVTPAVEEVPALAAVQSPDLGLVALGIVLLVAIMVLVLRHARRPTMATLGACILATTIAPTSNLLFAEGALTARTLYSPSLGAAMMAGALVAWVATTRARTLVVPALTAVCALGALMTWRETRVWRDTPSVITTMITRRPDNYRGHELLAYAARDAGRLDESVAHFGHAIALFPRNAELLTDAATVALRTHDSTTAVQWLETALGVSPRSARARTRLFAITRARGDSARAREILRTGLRLEPGQRTWVALLASPVLPPSHGRTVGAGMGDRSRAP